MINQSWWFTTLLIKQFEYCPPLNKSIKCDVLIVGGGFSGISAAAEFLGKGHYPYFSNRRHFILPSGLGRIIGKSMLFSLSNGWAKFYQVDTHRKPGEMTDEF